MILDWFFENYNELVYGKSECRKAEEEKHEIQQTKLEEKEARIQALKNLDFLGANSVKEFKELQKEIEQLKRKDSYTLWFNENKKTLNRLFDMLFKSFTESNEEVVHLYYTVEGYIPFEGEVLREDYLTELLKRYDYVVSPKYGTDNKAIGIEVRYKEKEE